LLQNNPQNGQLSQNLTQMTQNIDNPTSTLDMHINKANLDPKIAGVSGNIPNFQLNKYPNIFLQNLLKNKLDYFSTLNTLLQIQQNEHFFSLKNKNQNFIEPINYNINITQNELPYPNPNIYMNLYHSIIQPSQHNNDQSFQNCTQNNQNSHQPVIFDPNRLLPLPPPYSSCSDANYPVEVMFTQQIDLAWHNIILSFLSLYTNPAPNQFLSTIPVAFNSRKASEEISDHIKRQNQNNQQNNKPYHNNLPINAFSLNKNTALNPNAPISQISMSQINTIHQNRDNFDHNNPRGRISPFFEASTPLVGPTPPITNLGATQSFIYTLKNDVKNNQNKSDENNLNNFNSNKNSQNNNKKMNCPHCALPNPLDYADTTLGVPNDDECLLALIYPLSTPQQWQFEYGNQQNVAKNSIISDPQLPLSRDIHECIAPKSTQTRIELGEFDGSDGDEDWEDEGGEFDGFCQEHGFFDDGNKEKNNNNFDQNIPSLSDIHLSNKKLKQYYYRNISAENYDIKIPKNPHNNNSTKNPQNFAQKNLAQNSVKKIQFLLLKLLPNSHKLDHFNSSPTPSHQQS